MSEQDIEATAQEAPNEAPAFDASAFDAKLTELETKLSAAIEKLTSDQTAAMKRVLDSLPTGAVDPAPTTPPSGDDDEGKYEGVTDVSSLDFTYLASKKAPERK